MSENLKILIVDDTVTYRQILNGVCAGIDGVDVIGTASNGQLALSKIALAPPDLVLLDVSMPVMDGIEALKEIRTRFPDIDVVMVSGVDRGNANLTMKALSLGALDFIAKPQGGSPEESLQTLKKSLMPLISLVKTRMFSRQTRRITGAPSVPKEPVAQRKDTPVAFPGKQAAPPAPPLERPPLAPVEKRNPPKRIEAIGLGVSTGGPNALQKVIPLLEAELRVPILAVQHMPPTFTASLAERLDRDSKIAVSEARDGETIEKGRMYIAPGGSHIVVRRDSAGKNCIEVVDSPPVNSCKPSVDVLFRSMPLIYGPDILAVVLTGMGRDGASGVSAIRRRGGYCLIQDEATSVVWGMPQAVAESNDADEILPLDKIAGRIMEIAGRG
jgi:two-component system, chemotaxis family, protein-glutamate methylesterase/glutaminase